MISILKAFRDALVADTTLIAAVPAANIYVGVRDQKTPIPVIDIFTISGTTDKLAGAKIGGITINNISLQISIIAANEAEAQTITTLVKAVILSDNSTLNTAGIKDITQTGIRSILEDNGLCHIPLQVSFRYMFTI